MVLQHFVVTLGLIFVPLTGAVAYLIAREEYERHDIAPRKVALLSLGAGLIAAAIMAGLVVLGRLLLFG